MTILTTNSGGKLAFRTLLCTIFATYVMLQETFDINFNNSERAICSHNPILIESTDSIYMKTTENIECR